MIQPVKYGVYEQLGVKSVYLENGALPKKLAGAVLVSEHPTMEDAMRAAGLRYEGMGVVRVDQGSGSAP